MNTVQQAHNDLQFVRNALEQQGRPPRSTAGLYYWAIYTVIGFTLIDVAPHWANKFFLVGIPVGFVLNAILHRRMTERAGIRDSAIGRRFSLHWIGGVLLSLAISVLFCNIAGVRGPASGQLCILFIGMVYFFAGVHLDRMFLALCPILLVGGLLVGFVPHFGWTILGVILALSLMIPTFFTNDQATDDIFGRDLKPSVPPASADISDAPTNDGK